MCILFPQSMMCSWVNVFYEEICPRNLADFTVNILAVSYYLVVGLNFYPSLHRPMAVDYTWFCEEAAATGMMAFLINECVVDIPRTSSCPTRKNSLAINSFTFTSTAESGFARAQALLVYPVHSMRISQCWLYTSNVRNRLFTVGTRKFETS